MTLETLWFIVIARALDGLLHPGGVRPRGGHAARRPRQGRGRPPGRDQHHRPAVGRQRGVAHRRGGRPCSPRSPAWYATMFSGFYVVVVLLLAALIAARASPSSSAASGPPPDGGGPGTRLMTGGSLLVPLLTGIALGNLLHGLPIDSSGEYTGGLLDLLQPVRPVLRGHPAGALRVPRRHLPRPEDQRGPCSAARARWPGARRRSTALLVLLLTVWTHSIADRGVVPNVLQVAAVLAVVAAGWLLREPGRRMGLRRHQRRDRRDRPVPVRRPVPAADGVEHELRLRPHRAGHRVGLVRAQGDDRRHGDPVPGRAGLPGVDLLRVPRAGAAPTASPSREPAPVAPDGRRPVPAAATQRPGARPAGRPDDGACWRGRPHAARAAVRPLPVLADAGSAHSPWPPRGR